MGNVSDCICWGKMKHELADFLFFVPINPLHPESIQYIVKSPEGWSGFGVPSCSSIQLWVPLCDVVDWICFSLLPPLSKYSFVLHHVCISYLYALCRRRMERTEAADVGCHHHRLLLWLRLHSAGRGGVPHQRLAQAAAGHLGTWFPLHLLHLVREQRSSGFNAV